MTYREMMYKAAGGTWGPSGMLRPALLPGPKGGRGCENL